MIIVEFKRIIFLSMLFISLQGYGQRFIYQSNSAEWADTLLKVMTIDEKLGQLFMVPVYLDKDQKHIDKITELVTTYNIGGIIYFKSGPYKLANMTNYLQSKSRIPLFVSIDAEWGLPMRMDSTMQFPLQMTLGAIRNKELIYDMGQSIARQCKRLGIHISFSPSADINNNSQNPIINLRSFGDNREEVTERSFQYMKGLQNGGVLPVIKHFPGHGDTHTDSHKDLPVLEFSRSRLDSTELYPFKKLIEMGAPSVMVAHLFVPALDKTKNTATTLSKDVVTGLLRNEMGFNGLIFTDALNMKGVTKFLKPGEVDLKALQAGNDVLLYAEDVPKAIELMKQAIIDTLLTIEEVDEHVKRILCAKYDAGLNTFNPIDTTNLYYDLFSEADQWTNRQLAENAITLVRNNNEILPLKKLDTLKIALISLGGKPETRFIERMYDYCFIDTFCIRNSKEKAVYDSLLLSLNQYNLVIVTVSQTNRYSYRTFSLSDESVAFINAIPRSKKTILVMFSSPYSLSLIEKPLSFESIIMAYEPLPSIQDMTAQAIMGGIGFNGQLPVNVSTLFPRKFGIETKSIRLKYTLPEELGLSFNQFKDIDDLVNKAISDGVFPGCQIWASKNNKVFFRKSYGSTMYNNEIINNSHLYDLASLTKILASAPALMKLVDLQKITINQPYNELLPKIDNSHWKEVVLADALAHQAGFKAWIPFHLKAIKNESSRDTYFSKISENNKSIPVADSLFVINSMPDSIFKTITHSEIKRKGEYLYSDLGMYLVPLIVKEKTKIDFNSFLKTQIYNKLGLYLLTFIPLNTFAKERIVPTENDTVFRKQTIRGYVHDQGAALMGGISGHAGLFADANSVGVIMSMFLNQGIYGDEQIIDKETVKLFTSCYHCPKNRRGLVFDKPIANNLVSNPAAKGTSSLSFGHSGFTGTYTWADPKTGIVYVFLSNRVYPDAENKKLIESGLRTKILEILINETTVH